ncbi:MAG: hypothetical protein R3C10_28350, partial [Pirellulales bacterium]
LTGVAVALGIYAMVPEDEEEDPAPTANLGEDTQETAPTKEVVDVVTEGAEEGPDGLEVSPEQADRNMESVKSLPGASKPQEINTEFGPGVMVDIGPTRVVDRPGSKSKGRTLEVQRGPKHNRIAPKVRVRGLVAAPALGDKKADNNPGSKDDDKSDDGNTDPSKDNRT